MFQWSINPQTKIIKYLNPQGHSCHYSDNSSEQLGTVYVYNMTISES